MRCIPHSFRADTVYYCDLVLLPSQIERDCISLGCLNWGSAINAGPDFFASLPAVTVLTSLTSSSDKTLFHKTCHNLMNIWCSDPMVCLIALIRVVDNHEPLHVRILTVNFEANSDPIIGWLSVYFGIPAGPLSNFRPLKWFMSPRESKSSKESLNAYLTSTTVEFSFLARRVDWIWSTFELLDQVVKNWTLCFLQWSPWLALKVTAATTSAGS